MSSAPTFICARPPALLMMRCRPGTFRPRRRSEFVAVPDQRCTAAHHLRRRSDKLCARAALHRIRDTQFQLMLDIFPSREAGRFGRRLKQARGARIPVTIITGFLGAGKTTLLRRFLATPEGEGTAVVVNEFGNVGIDDALLRSSSDQITLLGNGCLCCTTRTDLQVTLRTLVAERDHGKVLPFRRIVIETSGLADPGPILQTFATDRALGGEFHVEVLATVIDAASGPHTLDWAAEARKQIILADRLIVSKTDIADSGVVDRLKQQLRLLNPRADIHTAIEGALDARVLIAPGEPPCGYVAEAAHSDGITSFVIMQNDPLPWNAFARAMETLITLRGP